MIMVRKTSRSRIKRTSAPSAGGGSRCWSYSFSWSCS